jgi:oxaloacetate decarboxylase
MNWTPRRERFRAILAGERCLVPGSVFDPISARIAADLGFEAGIFAGSIASFTVLGAPDLILLTLGELAAQAYRINRAADLPLLVDADHGYGNALNVKRTVEELENAGVAAIMIEDTRLPATFGEAGKTSLIPREEGVGKMRAALAGRQDPSLVIIGRTGALAVTGLDDTVERIRAYEAAGVDAVFVLGVKSEAELTAVAAAVNVPLLLGGAASEIADRSDLGTRRVRICLKGHQPFAAAVQAVYETLKAIHEGRKPGALAAPELIKRITRDADYAAWTREFLGG